MCVNRNYVRKIYSNEIGNIFQETSLRSLIINQRRNILIVDKYLLLSHLFASLMPRDPLIRLTVVVVSIPPIVVSHFGDHLLFLIAPLQENRSFQSFFIRRHFNDPVYHEDCKPEDKVMECVCENRHFHIPFL